MERLRRLDLYSAQVDILQIGIHLFRALARLEASHLLLEMTRLSLRTPTKVPFKCRLEFHLEVKIALERKTNK